MHKTREELMAFAKDRYGEEVVSEMDRRSADLLWTVIEKKYKQAGNDRWLYRIVYSGDGLDNTLYVIARDRVDAVVLAERDFSTAALNVSVERLAFVPNGELPDGVVAV